MSVGHDPLAFQWEERGSQRDGSGDLSPVLLHKPTGAYFAFAAAQFNPGRVPSWQPPDVNNRTRADVYQDWDETRAYFRTWAQMVKAELEAPDLWAEIASSREIVSSAALIDDNRAFTPRETEVLKRQLAELREFVVGTYARSVDQEKAIEVRFEYLAEAAERGMGRKDWLNILVSQVIALIVTGLVPPSAVHDILAKAHTLLAPIFTTVAGWLH